MQIKTFVAGVAMAGLSAMSFAAPADGVARNYYEGKTCYANGERAQGAAGEPEVVWLPCCSPSATQIEDPEMGYGKFCKEKTCYTTGERAQGAAGYPLVAWMRCCSETAEQVEDASLGWGKFCLEPEYKDPATEAPAVDYEEDDAEVEESPEETYIEDWETCGGRGEGGPYPCASENFECVKPKEPEYWGLRCQPAGSDEPANY